MAQSTAPTMHITEVRSSLQGGLLVPVPRLQDPNFERMVVLMVKHDQDGAFGIVLGEEVPATIGELCQEMGIDWQRAGAAPIRYGGPCEPNHIWLLHGGPEPLAESTAITPGLFFGSSAQLLQQLSDHPEVPFAALAGYAGWAPGQLERELQQNCWLPGEVTPELVFATDPKDLWDTVLSCMDLSPERIISNPKASA